MLKNILKYFVMFFELLLDISCFNAGIIIAFIVLGHYSNTFYFTAYWDDLLDFNIDRSQYLYAITVPLFVLPLFNIYGKKWSEVPFERLIDVWKANFVTTAFLLVAVYLIREHITPFPTSILLVSPFVSSILMSFWRLLEKKLGQYFDSLSPEVKKALVVGRLEGGVLERIWLCTQPVYDIIGLIDEELNFKDDGIPHHETKEDLTPVFGRTPPESLGNVSQLGKILEEHKPEEVFVVASQFSNKTMLEIIGRCELSGVRIRIIPGLYSIMANAVDIRMVNDLPVLDIGTSDITGWNYLLKRLMDVMISLVLLGPALLILLAASIAIVIDDKGWPIFSQVRVGRKGKLFKAYKLRTMRVTADEGPALTQDGDARITRLGRWLRKTSIDELPQIINVLKGEMSLIGPRAVIPMVVEGFSEWEKMSLNVKPGITGLAQVSGRDELGFKDKSVFNVYYIRNYSIAMDIKILMRTFAVVFSQVGTDGTRLKSH